MSGPAQRVRGLVAVIAIVALLGGVPYALWTWGGGTPWPSTRPGRDWLTESLGAEQVLGVLVAVLWLAWAHFTLCVVVEFFQGRRGTRRVPGGRIGTQPLARRLVASAMLLVGSAAATAPAMASATPGPNAGHGVAASGVDAVPAADQARSTRGATKRGALGDRAPEPAALEPGVAVRTSQGVRYEVQPPHNRQYDCLWDIAERYLGDGLRWKEIYRLNKDVEQPDGNALQDPDMIYPGWILQLPDDAKGADLVTLGRPDHTTQHDHHANRPPGGDPHGHRGNPDGDAGQTGGAGRAGDRSRPAPLREGQRSRQTPGDADQWAAPLGVGGGLVAAGLLLALRRRRGWQGGPGGAGGGPKPGDEASLRLAADSPTALLVDRAIRQLAHASYQGGQSLPVVRAAYVNERTFTLALETPARITVPDGWRSSPDGRTWLVDRVDAERFEPPAGVAMPCPALTTLGLTRDGTLVLANLASARGVVALGGALPETYEVALSMAAELCTAPWTDTLAVTLVGFAEKLADLAPGRVRQVNSIDAALSGATGVLLVGRAASAEQEQRLGAAIAQGSVLGAVIVGEADRAAWRLELTSHGRLVNPPLGLDVAAQRIPIEAAARLIQLFRWADTGRPAKPAGITAQPVPGFDPGYLEPDVTAPVSAQLLGPVRVDAPGEIEADRQPLATELVAYLALHPDGVHPKVLASAIWPRGVSDEVFEATIGRVQAWLGQRSDGGERLFQDEQHRWRLDLRDVRVDWHVAQAYVARAERSEDPTVDLASALSCVAGPALDELPAHRYAWLAGSTAIRDIQTTIVGVALRVSSVAADSGDPGLAHEALRTGLDMVPGCEELWRAELRLTHQHDGAEATHRVAEEMFVALGEHGSPRGAEATTAALVEELLPGHGPAPAGKIA